MGMMVGGALFGFSMVSVYISANSVSDMPSLDLELTVVVHRRQLFKCCRFSNRRQDAYAIPDRRKCSIMDHPVIRESCSKNLVSADIDSTISDFSMLGFF
jgi:hypothetical protein